MSGNDKDTEALLKPQSAWLDGGRPAAAGAAAGPWRSSAVRSDSSNKLASSRFDTSIGGSRWREDEREPVQRREGGRWGDAVNGSEATGAGGRQFGEPHNPAWTDVPVRGRGRGSEVDSWKPRERDGGDWRNSSDAGSLGTAGGSWRSERWGGGGAPGAPRGDSWRAGGGGGGLGSTRFGPTEPSMDGSRGFGMGRGRGRGSGMGGAGGLVGGIGSGGPASGVSRTFAAGGGVGGKMRWGASKAGHRYTTDQLARLYKQLLYSGRLRLPACVERDDPLLFLGDGEFVDVVEQLMGVDPAEVAQAFADHYSMTRAYSHRSVGAGGAEEGLGGGQQRQHSALLADAAASEASTAQQQAADQYHAAADEYVYKDPQGVVQGPFARQDIIDWYEAGYFPLQLEVRAAGEPADAPFKPLAALLKAWNKPVGPPGFAATAESSTEPAAVEPAAEAEPVSQAQPEPQLEPEPVVEPAAAPVLSLELPEAEDLLAASLQHIELSAAVPAPPPARMVEPADPIIDPALVKRSASSQLLHQQHLQHQQQQQQMLPPLPLGGPLAQLQAMGSGHLQQQQQHPDLLAGHFQAQHAHASTGLLPQQDPFLSQQHLMPPQHLPPAPLPHHLQQQQQQQQFAAIHAPSPQQQPQQHAELPAWLTEPVPPPALEQPTPQPAPAPAPAHAHAPAPAARQQPLAPAHAPGATAAGPRPSLLDIQREQELQEAQGRQQEAAEAHRRAEALEEERRQQQEAALMQQQQQQQHAAEQEAALPPPPPPPPRPAPQQPQAPRPETKVAPWAAAAPKKKTGKTLLEIQQEEAERAARLAAEEAAAAAAAPPGAVAPVGGWAKAARGNISGGSLSLREIQEEEERQRAAEAANAATLAAALAASKADTAPKGSSLAAAPSTGDDEDGSLFWDYGVQPGASAPPPPAARPAAATPPVTRKAAPPAPKSGWASAVAATTPAPIPAPAPAPPTRTAPAPPAHTSIPTRQPAPAAPVPAPAAAAPAAAALDPADAAAISEALTEGSSALQGAFRAWCQEQMRELTGSPDVTLCEFLLTVESNSELAEYCTLYLGASPAVSRFAAEFMRRKLAEAAAASKSSKSRKSKAKTAAATAAPAASASRAPAAGPPGYAAPSSAAFPALGAQQQQQQPAKKGSDWEKVPKAAGKKKKGKKMDSSMLGFASGTNYALLEQPSP